MRFLSSLLATWCLASIPAPTPTAAATEAPPPTNFIVIFVDDLGHADIEPFGPSLNRMAAESDKLTNKHPMLFGRI
jgi:hypothetical protein